MSRIKFFPLVSALNLMAANENGKKAVARYSISARSVVAGDLQVDATQPTNGTTSKC